MYGLSFFITSIGLGFGLAMDAVSVSIADSIKEPGMSLSKKTGIALTFGVFQFMMPLIGWFLVGSAVRMMGCVCSSDFSSFCFAGGSSPFNR